MTVHGTEKLAKALLLPINPALVVLLGIYTVVWGLWIANPFWHTFSSAPLYSQMAVIAPEWAWGLFAIFCGSVTAYGAVKRQFRSLTRGSATAFIHWILVCILYFMGDFTNTGGITALIIAVYAAVVYLNIRVNFKENPHSDLMMHE